MQVKNSLNLKIKSLVKEELHTRDDDLIRTKFTMFVFDLVNTETMSRMTVSPNLLSISKTLLTEQTFHRSVILI